MNARIGAAAPGEFYRLLVKLFKGRFYFALHGAHRLSQVALVLPLPSAKISTIVRDYKKNIPH